MKIATICAVGLLGLATTLNATLVSVSASFTGGTGGSWSFDYVSGAADLYLQQLTIDLGPTNLGFDTAAGGFGALSYTDVGNFAGSDVTTGLGVISPGTGAALDGGTLLTLNFSDFTPGDIFQFDADVDHFPRDCTGLHLLALAACNAANTAVARQFVGPNGVNGAVITYVFGGAGYDTTSFTGEFGRVTLRDIVQNLVNGNNPPNTTGSSTDIAPEPATWTGLAGGLFLIAGLLRRRSSRALALPR